MADGSSPQGGGELEFILKASVSIKTMSLRQPYLPPPRGEGLRVGGDVNYGAKTTVTVTELYFHTALSTIFISQNRARIGVIEENLKTYPRF